MRRSRWHDAVIVAALVALFSGGIWALWWDDVRTALNLDMGDGSAEDPVPVTPGRT